jgi:pilus assembly protein CpaF
MLQAMNTGHEGSMTTIHANSPRDALTRLQAMVGMAGVGFSENLVRETISRALDLLVQLQRGADGKRRVISISEVTGTEGNVITVQDIFIFQQHGLDSQGNVVGDQVATGVRPQCMERIRRAGFKVHEMSFSP